MKEKLTVTKRSLLILFLLSVITPLIPYLFKFGSLELSNSLDTWVSFANYWSPFLTLATAVFTGIIAYQALDLSSKAQAFNEKAEAPLITFEMVSVENRHFYIIKNAGKVPAVNCMLFLQESGSLNNWDQQVNCYVIKPDEVKVISWVDALQKAQMHYENFLGTKYTTTIEKQHNDFKQHQAPTLDMKIKSYTELTEATIEDEILKSLNSSSENKDDMKMLSDLLLQKSQDCNRIYFSELGTYGSGQLAFSECLNEIVISLQLLTTMSDAIGTQYIYARQKHFKQIFWIQLHVSIRTYIKNCYARKYNSFPSSIHEQHLQSLHSHFHTLYQHF
jgi:hypothetical protein